MRSLLTAQVGGGQLSRAAPGRSGSFDTLILLFTCLFASALASQRSFHTLFFAAWTKNEGLLFLLSAIIGQALSILLRKGPISPRSLRRLDAFGVGAAPLLALIFWFKHYVAPPGDLFASPSSMLSKLASPVRYWVVLKWYGKELLRFGEWWIVPLTIALAVLYLISSTDRTPEQESTRRASICTLGLTLAGYFAIYLITPNDLYWHLRFSLNRLFLAIWPSVIFLFFSSVSLRSLAKVSN